MEKVPTYKDVHTSVWVTKDTKQHLIDFIKETKNEVKMSPFVSRAIEEAIERERVKRQIGN